MIGRYPVFVGLIIVLPGARARHLASLSQGGTELSGACLEYRSTAQEQLRFRSAQCGGSFNERWRWAVELVRYPREHRNDRIETIANGLP